MLSRMSRVLILLMQVPADSPTLALSCSANILCSLLPECHLPLRISIRSLAKSAFLCKVADCCRGSDHSPVTQNS